MSNLRRNDGTSRSADFVRRDHLQAMEHEEERQSMRGAYREPVKGAPWEYKQCSGCRHYANHLCACADSPFRGRDTRSERYPAGHSCWNWEATV